MEIQHQLVINFESLAVINAFGQETDCNGRLCNSIDLNDATPVVTSIEVGLCSGFTLHNINWSIDDCLLLAESLLMSSLTDLKKGTGSDDFLSAAHWFFGRQEGKLTPEICASITNINFNQLLDGIRSTLPASSLSYILRMEEYYYQDTLAEYNRSKRNHKKPA